MKHIITAILLFISGVCMAETSNTPLQDAFANARSQKNIDLILPTFLKSELYVIVAETEDGKLEFFYTKSPRPERYCVTVSENEATLASVKWPKRKMTGLQLIQELPENYEIIVTYTNGGDYITREHLAWYRKQLP